MTAFRGYSNGQDPMSPDHCYNCLKGLNSTKPRHRSTTNNPTTFQMSGDPVAGTGWLDSDPYDRRFILASGPFTMAPGDTQRVAIALVAAKSRGRINSVRTMKQYAVAARQANQQASWAIPAGGRGGVCRGRFQWSHRQERPARRDGRPRPGPPGGGRARRMAQAVIGPNPAFGQVAIRISQPVARQYELIVVDTSGRVVRRLSG